MTTHHRINFGVGLADAVLKAKEAARLRRMEAEMEILRDQKAQIPMTAEEEAWIEHLRRERDELAAMLGPEGQ